MADSKPAIPQVQIDKNTPISDWPRIINQIQQNLIQAFNRLAMNLATCVSEVKWAYCTESQFQAAYGPNWILVDGRSVPGSRYAVLYGPSIPTMCGRVPRMKDNGAGVNPDGDLDLGEVQDDATALPTTPFTTGNMSANATHTHTIPATPRSDLQAGGGSTALNGYFGSGGTTGSTSTEHTHTVTGGGDSETRGKTSTINAFIRIN